MAFEKLSQELGRTNVVIKDCHGVGGNDITFGIQQILDDFKWKDEFTLVAVEEDLRYNDDRLTVLILLVFHFTIIRLLVVDVIIL